MRLVTKQSGRFTYLYAIKGYRTDDGKSTTKVVEKFGTIVENPIHIDPRIPKIFDPLGRKSFVA